MCIKLGNPFTFAEIDFQSIESKILALGLLGNPVSFLVGFHLFVVLAIRYLVGWTNPHHFRFVNFQRIIILRCFASFGLIHLISFLCRVQAQLCGGLEHCY